MNKKSIALFSAVVMLLLMLAPTLALANVPHAYVRTSNFGPLNMRQDISVNSPKIGSIPYGTRVVIQDYFSDNTWASVEYNGKVGYVMTRYLSMDVPPNPNPNPQPVPSTDLTRMFDGFQSTTYFASVRPATPGGFVHMRWAPSKQMGIMVDFYDGKQLEVLAQNNTWCQVRDPETEKTGFMMRSFLTSVDYGTAEQ